MKRTILVLAAATSLLTGAALAQDTSNSNISPVPGSSAGETSVIPPSGGTGGPSAASATAPSEQTSNPVPGTDQGKDSTMPAGAASAVVTNNDAPAVGSPSQQTSNPVPGTSTGDGNITVPAN